MKIVLGLAMAIAFASSASAEKVWINCSCSDNVGSYGTRSCYSTSSCDTCCCYGLETANGCHGSAVVAFKNPNAGGGPMRARFTEEAPGIFDRWGNRDGVKIATSALPSPAFEAEARNSLRKLAEAYSAKRRSAFMRLVSDDFAGDLSILEDALVKDFRNYRSVNLDLIPNRVEIEGPSASVEFYYNLTIVDDRGVNSKFSGRSNYVFRQEDGKVRLYKMEKPILFGNSLPSSENPVAASQNSLTERESEAPGAQSAIRGSGAVMDPDIANPDGGFKFDSQSNVPQSSADILKSGGNIAASPGGGIVSLGACDLDSVASAPSAITGSSAAANVGECYAVRTAANLYASLRITSIAGALGPTTITFDYKFQPGGSSSF